jgi:hypothetical protein
VADPAELDPPSELARDLDSAIDVARIEAEEAAAARRLSMIEAGRRKGGLLGAATAGAMIGLRDVYEGPPKADDVVIVSEAPGDPGDIDVDGITGRVADVDFWAPPPGDPRA